VVAGIVAAVPAGCCCPARQRNRLRWSNFCYCRLCLRTDLSGQIETFAAATLCCLPVAPTHRETALVRCPEAPCSGPGRSGGQQSAPAGAVTSHRYAPRAVALRRSSAPDRRSSLLAAPRLGWWPRCLRVSASQVRRRCHSGRHGRRRVAGRSLSALISLRNGRRGERDVALHRAARCSAAVCLLLADCSPVALCHPQVGHHGGCSEDRRHRVCSHVPSTQIGGHARDLGASVALVCTRWVPVLGPAAHA
jgi:hypothetical protein